LANTARVKNLPNPHTINTEGEYARRGEMANLMTRLTGVRYINVQATGATPQNEMGQKLIRIFERTGNAFLAEYGAHGGSFAGANQQGQFQSLELGGHMGTFNNLGYLTVPAHEAEREGLTAIPYADNEQYGYLNPATLQLRR
jgi:hypothetical protein